jgi:NADH-quinone oxidoreductase subunit G
VGAPPGAVDALLACTRALGMHERIGPGLLEVPEESNARGLREVGCTYGAGPGLNPTGQSAGPGWINGQLEAGELDALIMSGADPVRTHPDGGSWRRALGKAFVVAISMFDDESTKYADIVLPAESHAEKEGTVTHPDGRLQRLRPNVPHPDSVRPGWQFLLELSATLGNELGLHSAEDIFGALADEVPFYGGLDYETVGGFGKRWQERKPGQSWTPPQRGVRVTSTTGDEEADGEGLILGTYRDLWATEVTKRNPSLRFLMPQQRLEISAKDAKELELENGDEVRVSVNGTSVAARIAIKERIVPGTVFLIEGTDDENANVLTNGVPQRVKVEKS